MRVQQRNGKKYLTTIEGLDPKVDHQKVVKALRKILSCNGTIIKGKNVIQLQGKHGEKVKAFLVEEKICEKSGVIVHGE